MYMLLLTTIQIGKCVGLLICKSYTVPVELSTKDGINPFITLMNWLMPSDLSLGYIYLD
jgi:hypothetical protein